MARNAMQSAWNNKRKEDSRLEKLKLKKKQETGPQSDKEENRDTEEAGKKSE